MRKVIIIVLLIINLLLSYEVIAAEVLQVNSSKELLLGDNNRSYTIQIACIEVEPSKESIALKWLKKELPRRTKVNFRPVGFSQEVLVANVIKIKSNKDIAKSMDLEGVGEFSCSN